jgi:hypothetical protein
LREDGDMVERATELGANRITAHLPEAKAFTGIAFA